MKKSAPRRDIFPKEFLVLKLWACREIGRRLGYIGRTRQFREFSPIEPSTVMVLLAVYLDDRRPALNRFAIALMLDHLLPEWRGMIDPLLLGPIVDRNSKEVAAWRQAVLARDGECRKCGSAESLEAHHVIPWANAPDLRTDIFNGVALCESCHKKVTVANGR